MIGSISSINPSGNLPNEKNGSFIGDEKLKNTIIQLETDIADNSWYHKNYSAIDMDIMPALVTQANNKYPEMNLNFVKSPWDISAEIKKATECEIEHFRLIVNMGEDGIHSCVIDCKKINGKISLILFEPSNFNGDGSAILAFRIKTAIKHSQLPDYHLSIVEMDIQRSSSECGIFSLALAKKLCTERHKLLKIHEDNINGILHDGKLFLPYNELDPYLPVTFYKHTQGKGRLSAYLNTNPQAVGTVINKKNETILSRFNNNKSVINGKELSVSAHKKRVTEYKALLKP